MPDLWATDCRLRRRKCAARSLGEAALIRRRVGPRGGNAGNSVGFFCPRIGPGPWPQFQLDIRYKMAFIKRDRIRHENLNFNWSSICKVAILGTPSHVGRSLWPCEKESPNLMQQYCNGLLRSGLKTIPNLLSANGPFPNSPFAISRRV